MSVNANGMSNAGTSSAGQSFISTLIARMPYTYRIIQNALEANPKYDAFEKIASSKEARIKNQSIFQSQPDQPGGALMLDQRYHQLMYADVDVDKVRRLQEYRKMASYAELADCIEEIADESIVKDTTTDKILNLKLGGGHDRLIVDQVQKEWDRFIEAFNIEDRGWEMIVRFLIDGELYYEHVISENRPEYGILGFVELPSELINPVYDNIQNQIIQGYLLRKPIVSPKKTVLNQQNEELVLYNKNQVSYIHSGCWNEDRTIRLPYIEKSRRAYKQLSLIEDSIIIYRLVRAPERLVFKVDVGNMPVPKAEEYVKKLMQQYWSSKNFDSSKGGGNVTNVYNPQTMLDSFWFTKRGDRDGTEVTQLPGGCLSMDTKIPLLDGRVLDLNELTKEYNNGIQNWVYSCNPETGRTIPGKISWAGVTHESANVMKLTFDNGKELICTPDHKFPSLSNGKKRADELSIGESIFALYKEKEKINEKTSEYEKVYQHDTKDWEFTHRMVVKSLKETDIINEHILNPNDTTRRGVIHHRDFDRFNNSPENLELMTYKDHYNLHARASSSIINENISTGLKKYYNNISKEEKKARYMPFFNGLQKWRNQLTDEDKLNFSNKMKEITKKSVTQEYRDLISNHSKQQWLDPEIRQKRCDGVKNKWKDVSYQNKMNNHKGIVYNENTFLSLISIVVEHNLCTLKSLVIYINNNLDNIFSKQFMEDNVNKSWCNRFTEANVSAVIKHYGYKNYSHFRKEVGLYNHKITNIEYLKEPITVGTLTIDKDHEIHDYHTFALDCGIYTFNSNLGSLEDLMYFTKKLYKTLKVPTNRLDPADPFKDGTEITREELRFARFIIRIQSQIAKGLKQSFITHLKLREKKKDEDEEKSIWNQLKLREHQIDVTFNMPTSFAVMRDQQIFNIKKENFSGLANTDLMSQSFCQKYYLGLTPDQMGENREWLRKDAGMSWEIQQIITLGPNFKEQLKLQQEMEQQLAGGVGATEPQMPGMDEAPSGGGENFSPDVPPDFGQMPGGTTNNAPPAEPQTAPQPTNNKG